MFTLCLVDVSTTRTIAVGVRIPRHSVFSLHFRRRNSASYRLPAHTLRLHSAPPPPVSLRHFSMDSFFVNALVRASLCKIHSSSHSPVGCGDNGLGAVAGSRGVGRDGYWMNSSLSRLPASNSRRGYHPGIVETDPRPPYAPELKTELISFTDPYYSPDAPPEPNDKKAKAVTIRRLQSKNTQKLPWLTTSTQEDKAALEDFLEHLGKPKTSLEHLFKLYRKIPSPKFPHLTLSSVELFVGRMMSVPLRDEMTMLRYLSILDDMKVADLPISRNEWNAAVSFVARAFKGVAMREAKSAIQIWKESELMAGVTSDTTTFNILLDMASKSDTPVLAEWVLREMETRGIDPDRFTYTTIITFHGFRGDGEKIRETYRQLVDAGEIVDTVVLNAVMSALIRAREPQSAEYIYENMKRITLDPPNTPPVSGPKDWQGKRAWAQDLKRITEQRRIIKDYMKDFNASLAPDIYTFNMLILQYCRIGDYDKTQVLLGEMKECTVEINETIFVAVLKGFYWYGDMRYTPWTPERLDIVMKEVFEENLGIFMERSLAIWILRAVAKVYNSKKKVLRAWEIIERRWESEGGIVDEAAVHVLRDLVGWDVISKNEDGGTEERTDLGEK